MPIADSLHAGQPALALSGRFDARNAEAAADRLLAAVEDGRSALVLDCGAVDYMGATALRILLMVARRAAARRVTLDLVGLPPSIRGIMAASGVDRWAEAFGMRLAPEPASS